jgi:hypothetical protein
VEPIFDFDTTGFPVPDAPRVTGKPAVQCTIIRYGNETAFSELPRTIPTNSLWCTVIHCRRKPWPSLLPFLYYLRDPLQNGICVLAWGSKKNYLKRYRTAMRLTGYHHAGTAPAAEFFTVSDLPFSCPTKTRKSQNDVTKKSSRQLLKKLCKGDFTPQPKILEVGPTEGLFSQEAIKLGCHTTVAVEPEKPGQPSLAAALREKFTHEY